MEVIILPDAATGCALAAQRMAQLLRNKPSAVLGLATGSTPLGVYRELIRLHREDKLDFQKARTFNLDEYLGLPPEHPASYHWFMRENLFRHINITSENVSIPDGLSQGAEVPTACQSYEEAIKRAGGIDLQLLGIGRDGHIGFNEPASSLASRTRIKTLTPQTRADNARFFEKPEAVPHHVITMGVGTIMESREVLLLAFGAEKASTIAATVEGPLTSSVPASILQMHPTARIIVDEAAASSLQRADYYRWVYDHKPVWQQF